MVARNDDWFDKLKATVFQDTSSSGVEVGTPTRKTKLCVKDGIRFQQGQSISVPGQCMKITCEDAATNGQSGIICAYAQPRPGCRWSSTNYALPYPQCCPVEIC
ncbi:hypothetical protein RN001_013035 [Aquatica leii]|uniref:Single domain-containing protein n=1 Tax=Aquatica leii TaxID=1421715 RepID=A0AAN7SNK5_9COLE|nr:hypothetical protein RN001_013035 [Aquatica leii]